MCKNDSDNDGDNDGDNDDDNDGDKVFIRLCYHCFVNLGTYILDHLLCDTAGSFAYRM